MSVATPTKDDQSTPVETTETEIFNGYTAPTARIPACSTYHPLSKGKGKEKSTEEEGRKKMDIAPRSGESAVQ